MQSPVDEPRSIHTFPEPRQRHPDRSNALEVYASRTSAHQVGGRTGRATRRVDRQRLCPLRGCLVRFGPTRAAASASSSRSAGQR